MKAGHESENSEKEKGEIPRLSLGDGYTASGRARGRFLSETMEQRHGSEFEACSVVQAEYLLECGL